MVRSVLDASATLILSIWITPAARPPATTAPLLSRSIVELSTIPRFAISKPPIMVVFNLIMAPCGAAPT